MEKVGVFEITGKILDNLIARKESIEKLVEKYPEKTELLLKVETLKESIADISRSIIKPLLEK